ncbi:sulfatase [Psychromonas sp. CNPT3]|uniref:phosphoethanolamine transferase n=1 Tax=Psychromonas sp. CNPT3 TaxID=314282 RepID=UPI0002C0B88E|nr:phosphoethanolamine--lipid A transferase [Psychromonas sp. CNPT3]AGH81938.1 sulfatase [Psychromonas sp. CNPT3]
MILNFLKQLKEKHLVFKMNTLILCLSAYYALIFNQPLLQLFFDLAKSSPPLVAYSGALLLLSAFIIVFSCISLPYLFKIIMIPLILTSSLSFYATKQYHVLFDTTMIENLLSTDLNESLTYLNAYSVMYFLVLGALPAILLFFIKIKYAKNIAKEILHRAILVVSACLIIFFIAFFYYKDYASIGRNNAYLNKMILPAYAFNFVRYLNHQYLTKVLPFKELGNDATLSLTKNNKPNLVVVVLGETARAQNYTYNGYTRNSSPYTKSLDMIPFLNTRSCGTYTALSVPCMFSNMSRANYNKARATTEDNLLDIMQKSGVSITWIENDGGDKGVAKRLSKIEVSTKNQKPYCSSNNCFDEALISELKQQLATKNNIDRLIVLHLKGSHGPTYWQRYPSEKSRYTPSCDQKDIEHCTDEEIVNVYDNSLVYTDFIVSLAIKALQKQQSNYNVALTYISDHGESLGEKGLYLHGTPYAFAPKEQTHVPWSFWLPEQYMQAHSFDSACIRKKGAIGGLSHDNFFHSMLGLLGVNTRLKDNNLDLFSTCNKG